MTPWAVLRIEPTGDERDIKRAYARLLKGTRPEDDPAAFQQLRDAYEYALNVARYAPVEELAPVPDLPEVVAAPQVYEDPAFGPFAVARLQPEVEVPELARRDPQQEAERLWTRFLGTAALAPRHELAQLADSEDMLDLEVRERFELCAVRYCAGAACPDPVRAALAEFFQWQTDAAFIARAAFEETHEMLARLRAQQSLAFFVAKAEEDPAVKALLSDSARPSFWRTLDATFTRNMQELIGAIRLHHAEMLHFKLDRDAFESWERCVEGRRYFMETAGYSVVAGAGLWLVALLVLVEPGLRVDHILSSLIGCQLVAFALVGGFAIYAPAGARDPVRSARNYLQFLLRELRFQPAWQFRWIGLYLLGGACLAIPAPHPAVALVVTAVLLAALAGAGLANWGILNRWAFVIAAIVGFALGSRWSYQTGEGYGPVAWVAAVTCGMLLLYRGGADLCQWLEVPERRLPLLRAGWLAGAVGLLVATHQLALPLAACVLATFLWLTAGMLLSVPSTHHFIPYLSAVMIRMLVLDKAPVVPPSPVPGLSIGLIVVAIFMVVNMARANKNQHHFS